MNRHGEHAMLQGGRYFHLQQYTSGRYQEQLTNRFPVTRFQTSLEGPSSRKSQKKKMVVTMEDNLIHSFWTSLIGMQVNCMQYLHYKTNNLRISLMLSIPPHIWTSFRWNGSIKFSLWALDITLRTILAQQRRILACTTCKKSENKT